MGDSYGAELSVWSGAHQGALGQPTPRLAIKHGQCPLWVKADLSSGRRSVPMAFYGQDENGKKYSISAQISALSPLL